MSFFVLTCLGIAAAIVHMVVSRTHRVGPASAFALGIAGAWGGALLASTFVEGGWIAFGKLAFAGALLGSFGAVIAVEIAADRYLRNEGRAV